MIDLSQIIGFHWDENNREKNWEKHGVLASECEEVFSTCLSCFNPILPIPKKSRDTMYWVIQLPTDVCLLHLPFETTKSV